MPPEDTRNTSMRIRGLEPITGCVSENDEGPPPPDYQQVTEAFRAGNVNLSPPDWFAFCGAPERIPRPMGSFITPFPANLSASSITLCAVVAFDPDQLSRVASGLHPRRDVKASAFFSKPAYRCATDGGTRSGVLRWC